MWILVLFLLFFQGNNEPLQLFYVSTSETSSSSHRVGSVNGGTTLYINGLGFNPNAIENNVFVGYRPCIIPAEGVTTNFLICETTASGE